MFRAIVLVFLFASVGALFDAEGDDISDAEHDEELQLKAQEEVESAEHDAELQLKAREEVERLIASNEELEIEEEPKPEVAYKPRLEAKLLNKGLHAASAAAAGSLHAASSVANKILLQKKKLSEGIHNMFPGRKNTGSEELLPASNLEADLTLEDAKVDAEQPRIFFEADAKSEAESSAEVDANIAQSEKDAEEVKKAADQKATEEERKNAMVLEEQLASELVADTHSEHTAMKAKLEEVSKELLAVEARHKARTAEVEKFERHLEKNSEDLIELKKKVVDSNKMLRESYRIMEKKTVFVEHMAEQYKNQLMSKVHSRE